MTKPWNPRPVYRGRYRPARRAAPGRGAQGLRAGPTLLGAVLAGLGYAWLSTAPVAPLGPAGEKVEAPWAVKIVDGEQVEAPWAAEIVDGEKVETAWAVEIVDGDTFRHGEETIRIADIDAPETHPPRCQREADLGERATARMAALLAAGPFELARTADGRDEDRYGRKLRIAMRDGNSLGAALVEEGLARPWVGRRLPWCD